MEKKLVISIVVGGIILCFSILLAKKIKNETEYRGEMQEDIASETDFSVSPANIDEVNEIEETEDFNETEEVSENEKTVPRRISIYEEVAFVNDEMFETLKEIYQVVDFTGEFKVEYDEDIEDYYKQKYKKLVQCEVPFFDKESQQNFYINEFSEFKLDIDIDGYYNPEKFSYYFFDMDEDGTPELCIASNMGRFIYTFKYSADTDTFLLWHNNEIAWRNIIGSKKLAYGNGADYAYIMLDQEGEVALSLWFYYAGYYDTKTQQEGAYMVGLPQYKDKSIEVSEEMKGIAHIEEYFGSLYYFRVTEEQWKILTDDFFSLRKQAEEGIKEVTYTYDELFGE